MENTRSQQVEYVVSSIILEPGEDRYEPLDLTQTFISADIYESLDKPYITADLILLDNRDWYEKYDILGGEKITMIIASRKNTGGFTPTPIKKTFFIKSVLNNERVDENTQVVVFSLYEDILYAANLQNLNRFYEGKGSDIIKKIGIEFLKRHDGLGTNVSFDPDEGANDQQIYNLIVPNLDPLQACKWICDKMSTDKGFPFFLYSSLYTDRLILRNLEQLLKSPPINPNPGQEYHYGQGKNMSNDTNLARKVIISAKLGKSEDLFKIIEKGYIGSDICYLNTALPDASTEIRFDYDVVKDTLKPALDASIFPRHQNNPGYTPAFKLDGKPFNEYQSRNITLLGGSNPFRLDDLPSDGSVPQYPLALGEAYDEAQYKLFVSSQAIKSLLTKAPLTMIVNGVDFIDGDNHSTIGNQIRCSFFKTNRDKENKNELAEKDSKMSGDYLIYRTRHILKKNRYDLTLTMCKLGSAAEGGVK
tara:strand:- start:1693 stop:3120 length:1428 start_codon:yes stop_codon:yes gene_type:complete